MSDHVAERRLNRRSATSCFRNGIRGINPPASMISSLRDGFGYGRSLLWLMSNLPGEKHPSSVPNPAPEVHPY